MASSFEIVGHLDPLPKREWLRQRPSSSPGPVGDAPEPTHVCPYCGSPTARDDSRPVPFDVTCERCLSTLADLESRIERCLQSLRDLQAGLTDSIFVPVRPGWPKRRSRA